MDSLASSIEDHSKNTYLNLPPEVFTDIEETKGEFLPDMTEAEVLDYERKERLGWKDFKLPWQNDLPVNSPSKNKE